MVRLLAASLLMSALRQVPVALLRRELAFRRRARDRGVARNVVQGAVSIMLAATAPAHGRSSGATWPAARSAAVVAWARLRLPSGPWLRTRADAASRAPAARVRTPAAAQALLAR